MRDLEQNELQYISGGSSPRPPSAGSGCSPSAPSKSKNNNGYGNGAESGNAPGNSFGSNPTLVTNNSGNRAGPNGDFAR